MPIGNIENKCTVLVTLDEDVNRMLADEVVRIPGFDISRKKKFDIDGVDFMEEEEIHFVMIKDPQTSEEGRTEDDDRRKDVLDSLQDYMESEYPTTHTKSFKILYGEEPDRIDKFLNKTDSDLLLAHKEHINSVDAYLDKLSVPLVLRG